MSKVRLGAIQLAHLDVGDALAMRHAPFRSLDSPFMIIFLLDRSLHMASSPSFWSRFEGSRFRPPHGSRTSSSQAFRTTPAIAMEIEASIPPVDINEYKLDMEAFRLSRLNDD